jgi:hypothetical protein
MVDEVYLLICHAAVHVVRGPEDEDEDEEVVGVTPSLSWTHGESLCLLGKYNVSSVTKGL